MQPLYSSIHEHLIFRNITPIQNKELLQFSCEIPNNQKYDYNSNSGKIVLVNLLKKFNIKTSCFTKKARLFCKHNQLMELVWKKNIPSLF